MHKFRLLLLSLFVFTSALHAGDKENVGQNQSSFIDRFIFPTSNNVSKEKLSQRRGSVPAFPQALSSTPKPQEISSENDLLRKEFQGKLQQLRVDLLEGQLELQKQLSGIEPQIAERLEGVIGSLGNSVVEVKEVPHNLQPAVDDLKSQLQELLQKTATYEEQLQSAASQKEFEQVKKDLEATLGEIYQTVEELPTSEEVKTAIGDLTKGFKGYFATKEEMLGLFVEKHKVDQSVVSALKKDIATVTEQMPTQSNPQGFARNADVDGRVDALKKQMDTKSDLQSYVTQDDLAAQLVDKANRSDLNGYATKDDMQEIKGTIPTVENPQGFARQANVDQKAQVLQGQIENLDKGDNPVVRSETLNDRLKDVAKKGDVQDFVSQKTHEETVLHLQKQITNLEKNSPKEQLKSGVIYFAKQGALGCVAYQLSPHMASLLRSLKLENSYVDLETVAVPTTTFAVSLLARLAKEGYDKGQNASLQEVGKETLLDAGVSAGIMGLRYICFDDQMNEYVNQTSEQKRTAGYAFSYALLRSLIALFV